MGGRKFFVKLIIGAFLMPSMVFANTVPSVVKNTKSVEIIPISKEDRQKYSYNKYEYWLNGTDIVDNFSIQQASDFYTALLQTLSDNFVYDIPYVKMLNYVLEGLSGFYGKLDITIANTRVLVHDKNLKLIGNFNTPVEGDTRAWANLIVNVILSLREINQGVKNVHPEQIYYLTSKYLLKSLDENAKYSDNISLLKKKNEYNSHILGFTYRRTPYGLQVLSIINDSPLYHTNIVEGDLITHLNTVPVSKLKDEEIEATFNNDISEIVHINYISYISGQTDEVYVKRNKVIVPSIYVDIANPKVPVISIMNFKPKSSYELKDSIDKVKSKADGLIIDLRANSGGDFTEAVEMANLFINGGEILKTKGLGANKNQSYTAKSGDILNDKPIVIIADNTTKAEAEIFAFILQSMGRAVLIGSPTFGNGTVKETFDLPNKAQITFTTKQVVSPNDYVLNKVGVIPLVCLSSFKTDSDIDIFISNVKDGKFKDNRERFLATPSNTDIERVRKTCPALYPLKDIQKLPITIATKIIGNSEVYNKLKSMKY